MSNRANYIYNNFAGDSIFGSADLGSGKVYNHRHDKITEEYDCNLGEYNRQKNHEYNWIKFGLDDQTPDRIEEFMRMSGIHRSAIRLKTNLIKGATDFDISIPDEICSKNKDGIYELVKTGFTTEEAKEQHKKEVELWLKNIGARKYKATAAAQTASFGGYFSLRFYALNKESNVYLQRLHVEANRRVRLGGTRQYVGSDFVSDKIFIHNCFRKAKINEVIEYDDFDANDSKGKKEFIRTVDYDSQTLIEQDEDYGVRYRLIADIDHNYRGVYPTPDYESKKFFHDCNTDFRLSAKNSKDSEDGFTLQYIIVRNRMMIKNEEQEAIAKKQDLELIQNNYKGAFGSDSMMLWVEPAVDMDGKTTIVEPITIIEIPNNDNSEKGKNVRSDSTAGILSGHGIVAPELIGVTSNTGKGFANVSDYLITAIEQLHWNIIAPYQDNISDELTDLAIASGYKCKIKIKSSTPALRQITDEILLAVCTDDEIREFYRKQPLTEKQKIEIVERAESNISNAVKTEEDG